MTDQDIIASVKSLIDGMLSMGGVKNLETARQLSGLMTALEERLHRPLLVN